MSRPPVAELPALPLHVLVRDFPETLTVLRRFGIEMMAGGGETLAAAAGAALAPVYEAVCRATAWRDASPPGPCDREAARIVGRRAALPVARGGSGGPALPPCDD